MENRPEQLPQTQQPENCPFQPHEDGTQHPMNDAENAGMNQNHADENQEMQRLEHERIEQVRINVPQTYQWQMQNPSEPTEPCAYAQAACPTCESNAESGAPSQKLKTMHKSKNKHSRATWKAVAMVMTVVLAVGIGCFLTAWSINAVWGKRVHYMQEDFENKIAELQTQIQDLKTPTQVIIGSGTASAEGLTPAQVYAMNVRAVVMIRSSNRMSYSSGSGFILSENGYIVTNHHVIEGGTELTVITHDGKEHRAQLIGSDNTNDVALLKIDAKGLQAVVIGNSSELVVGDQVAAIGNPLGELTSTLTVGYVSAMERDVTTDGFAINMFQTDAAINSGNSGGPLFNMRGEVVGITTAKYSGTSSSGASIEGVGFAIPIDDVKELLEDLVSYGYITGAYMGVRVSDMDQEAAGYYGLPVGAYIQSTDPGSPAELAGLQGKDIIVKLGTHEIRTVSDLTRALRSFEAGETTTVVVYRSGAEVKLTITLAEKPVA